MKRHRLTPILPLILVLLSEALSAQTLNEYVATCKSRLGLETLPAISCDAGVNTSRGRIGRLSTNNRSVDAIYLCRPGLTGLIIHNRVGGDTCFFDAKEGKTSGIVNSPFGPFPSLTWLSPEEMNNRSVSRCHECHSNDPFITTPDIQDALVALDIYGGGHAEAPYAIPGLGVFREWEDFVEDNMQNNTCASGCHRLSSAPKFNSLTAGSSQEMPPLAGSTWALRSLPIGETFSTQLGWKSTGSYTWQTRNGSTPSYNTGPARARSGSHYAFFETSAGYAYNAGNTATLESDEFIANSMFTRVSFSYHMYGADIGALSLDVYQAGVWNNNVWSITGQQQSGNDDAWREQTVLLTGYTGQIKVRFRAVADGGYRGDIGIDEIKIYDYSHNGHFLNPTRDNQYGTEMEIWATQTNGNQLCREIGYTSMSWYENGCGEDESSFLEYRNGDWMSKSSGSANQCYPIFSKVVCR